MSIDVTVLGSSGSHTAPGQVCSGYLFRSGGTQVLVDCGNGSSANLQLVTSFDALDAILVTHRHIDHCADLIGMFYALRFHPEGPRQLRLYAAPEVVETLTSLLSEDSRMEFREVFHVADVAGGDTFDVGPLHFRLYPSVHPVPTVSVRAEAGSRVVAYSSDSAGGPDLVSCARGADLFLCEATWQGDAEDYPPGLHLTARAAGEVATRAEVDRLVLTHIVGSADRERSRKEARETFDGDVGLARDRDVLTLP